MVGNEAPSLHHFYEPGGDYQAKLELLARSEVPDSTLPEAYHYLIPGLKLSGDSRQIYGRAAQVPEVSKEYSVDRVGYYSLHTLGRSHFHTGSDLGFQ